MHEEVTWEVDSHPQHGTPRLRAVFPFEGRVMGYEIEMLPTARPRFFRVDTSTYVIRDVRRKTGMTPEWCRAGSMQRVRTNAITAFLRERYIGHIQIRGWSYQPSVDDPRPNNQINHTRWRAPEGREEA